MCVSAHENIDINQGLPFHSTIMQKEYTHFTYTLFTYFI